MEIKLNIKKKPRFSDALVDQLSWDARTGTHIGGIIIDAEGESNQGGEPADDFSPLNLFGPGDNGGIWKMSSITPNPVPPQLVALVADESGLGNDLTAAGAARPALSMRLGEAIAQHDFTATAFSWPFVTAGTFWCRTMSRAHVFELTPDSTMPPHQFMQAGFIDRALTSDERTSLVAYLNGIVETTHDFEVFSTDLMFSSYYWQQLGNDPQDIGGTFHVDFETSTDTTEFPAGFDLGGPPTYYTYLSGLAPREYADLVIAAAGDLEALEIGGWNSTDALIGPVYDLTLVPGLRVFVQHGRFEGTLPPLADFPSTLETFLVNSPAETGEVGLLSGNMPDWTNAPFAAAMKRFYLGGTNLRGAVDLSNFPALEYMQAHGNAITEVVMRDLANFVGTVDVLGSSVSLIDLNGSVITGSQLNDLLNNSANSPSISNCAFDLRVAAGVVRTSASDAHKATCEGRACTFLQNITFDPDAASTEAHLSNVNRTMTTTDYTTYSDVRTKLIMSPTYGPFEVKFICNYTPGTAFISVGLATAGWNSAAGAPFNTSDTYFVAKDGINIREAFADLGFVVAPGDPLYVRYDPNSGNVWFDCKDDIYLADAEADINPHTYIAPGEFVFPASCCFNFDDVTPCGVTIEPTSTHGRFISVEAAAK